MPKNSNCNNSFVGSRPGSNDNCQAGVGHYRHIAFDSARPGTF